jgi:hypothetical protein
MSSEFMQRGREGISIREEHGSSIAVMPLFNCPLLHPFIVSMPYLNVASGDEMLSADAVFQKCEVLQPLDLFVTNRQTAFE